MLRKAIVLGQWIKGILTAAADKEKGGSAEECDAFQKSLRDVYKLNDGANCEENHEPDSKDCSNPKCLSSILRIISEYSIEMMMDDKQTKTFCCGLRNPSALCYMNTFIQLWYQNRRFRSLIYEWNPVESGGGSDIKKVAKKLYIPDENSTIAQLQMLFAMMEIGGPSCTVSPLRLAESLNLNLGVHQDPQEFATEFLTRQPYIREHITKDLFEIQINSTIKCTCCGKVHASCIQMLNLQLPVPKSQQTLYEMIQESMAREILEGNNLYDCKEKGCSSFGKSVAIKEQEFASLPPTLIFQLLPYDYDKVRGQAVKLTTIVELPLHLDLTSFLAENADNTHRQYELDAIVLHLGSEVSHGHYVVCIRDPESGEWHSCSDKTVEKLNKAKLLERADSSLPMVYQDSLLTNVAYLAVYNSVKQDEMLLPLIPPKVVKSVETRMEMIKELKINPNDNSGELIPLPWMKTWAKGEKAGPIDNKNYLCQHGRLDFTKVGEMRVVSDKLGEMIFDNFGGGPSRLQLPQALCRTCFDLNYKLLDLQKRLDNDQSKVCEHMERFNESGSGTSHGPNYLMSRFAIKRWRLLAECVQQWQISAAHDDAAAKGLDEEPAAKKCKYEQVLQYTLNRDLECPHGYLTPNSAAMRTVPESVWNTISSYFEEKIVFSEAAVRCRLCPSLIEVHNNSDFIARLGHEVEKRFSFVRSLQVESSIFMKNRDDRPAVLYAVPAEFVEALRDFVQDPVSNDPPMMDYSDQLCNAQNHAGGLKALLDFNEDGMVYHIDSGSCVLIKQSNWNHLTSYFPSEHEIQLITSSDGSAADTFLLGGQLGMCKNCVKVRTDSMVSDTLNLTIHWDISHLSMRTQFRTYHPVDKFLNPYEFLYMRLHIDDTLGELKKKIAQKIGAFETSDLTLTTQGDILAEDDMSLRSLGIQRNAMLQLEVRTVENFDGYENCGSSSAGFSGCRFE